MCGLEWTEGGGVADKCRGSQQVRAVMPTELLHRPDCCLFEILGRFLLVEFDQCLQHAPVVLMYTSMPHYKGTSHLQHRANGSRSGRFKSSNLPYFVTSTGLLLKFSWVKPQTMWQMCLSGLGKLVIYYSSTFLLTNHEFETLESVMWISALAKQALLKR